ncbi:MAG: hypothetical protein ACKO7Z_11340 [Cyanobacteriota bacterium]
MATLTSAQRDELQAFIKDWLRHAGRSQSDLRRALQASSIRLAVLLDALAATYASQGPGGLAAQLCAIEDRWRSEDPGDVREPAGPGDDPLAQLDLLLREIRQEH